MTFSVPSPSRRPLLTFTDSEKKNQCAPCKTAWHPAPLHFLCLDGGSGEHPPTLMAWRHSKGVSLVMSLCSGVRKRVVSKRVVLADVPLCQKLGCRKWGCNKWGLKGCLAARPGNRPKSALFALFLPFLPFSGGAEEHLENPENGGKRPFFPQISWDLLKPPSLKPPFAALQKNRNEATFGCSPRSKDPERGYIRMFPNTQNRNEGTFTKTALLFGLTPEYCGKRPPEQ